MRKRGASAMRPIFCSVPISKARPAPSPAAHAGEVRDIRRAGRRAAPDLGASSTVERSGGRGRRSESGIALALAIALDGLPAVAALSGDPDGTRWRIGRRMTQAGAIIDDTTLVTRPCKRGRRRQTYLLDND